MYKLGKIESIQYTTTYIGHIHIYIYTHIVDAAYRHTLGPAQNESCNGINLL